MGTDRVASRCRSVATRSVILACACVVLAGCGQTDGPRDERVPESTVRLGEDLVVVTGSTLGLRTPEGHVRGGDGVDTFEGSSATYSSSDSLPGAWPQDFPLPAGAEFSEANVLSTGQTLSLQVRFRVRMSPSSVVDHLTRELRSDHPVVDEIEVGETSSPVTVVSFAGRWTGAAQVSERDGGTWLVVTLNFAEEGQSDGSDDRAQR